MLRALPDCLKMPNEVEQMRTRVASSALAFWCLAAWRRPRISTAAALLLAWGDLVEHLKKIQVP